MDKRGKLGDLHDPQVRAEFEARLLESIKRSQLEQEELHALFARVQDARKQALANSESAHLDWGKRSALLKEMDHESERLLAIAEHTSITRDRLDELHTRLCDMKRKALGEYEAQWRTLMPSEPLSEEDWKKNTAISIISHFVELQENKAIRIIDNLIEKAETANYALTSRDIDIEMTHWIIPLKARADSQVSDFDLLKLALPIKWPDSSFQIPTNERKDKRRHRHSTLDPIEALQAEVDTLENVSPQIRTVLENEIESLKEVPSRVHTAFYKQLNHLERLPSHMQAITAEFLIQRRHSRSLATLLLDGLSSIAGGMSAIWHVASVGHHTSSSNTDDLGVAHADLAAITQDWDAITRDVVECISTWETVTFKGARAPKFR